MNQQQMSGLSMRVARRRGSVLIYTLILLTLMFAVISLAVDFGRIQLIKTELQRCADATARGTIQEYLTYGSSVAVAYSPTLAADNSVDSKSGVSPTVVTNWGWWNASTNAFVPGAGSPVAVQVTVSRTTQTGNPVPLTFPLISGGLSQQQSCDVWATAVASVATRTLVNYPAGFTSSAMSLSGSASISGTHLRLTPATGNCAGSGWAASPVPINSFTNSFQFQLTSAVADGMAFVIQNTSKTALGATGGGLGCSGIGHSIAIKFDIYNNAGEGTNSTGIFANGAAPYTPSMDLTPSGLNIKNGHAFNVVMTYDGTTLSWTITDATTGTSGTYSSTVNIPSVIGAPTAYVGFTGGTGGSTAQQDVLTWTYSASGPVLEQ